MDSPYSNGAYSPPYPPAPAAAPHYAGLAQDRGYYGCGTPQSPFPTEPTGMYRPPSPSAPWSYSPSDGPSEGSSRRRQQGPGYSPPQTPSLPIPQYPYRDASAGLPGPPPPPRAAEDSWGPCPAFGLQPRYAWPPAALHGSPFACQSPPPWAASGAPSHPPAWDSQDSPYDQPEPGTNQQHYYSDGNHHQHSGTQNSHKPAPPLSTKPPAPQPKVQYSAQPQLYDGASRKLPPGRAGAQAAPAPAAIQPEIQRILHVMGEAEQLEQEVDEFVGRKTEKSYRLLEEMLTKLLLELDSIETGGQDSVRQARKESVHRIQAILEKLERKGL
ncbi:BAG family molecular chaperone regulator 4 [Colius striatus]|uniref:BAG family molecular chaperone regulator 4 n=1 Tax=Colius striatus TaxID=57412 RepID=UPI002B1DEF4A|nr:BAG family molecular chaperone regulator 4 [Colius striatus]